MMEEFITLESLGSFTVMVFVVCLVVQFAKGLVKKSFSDYAVRILSFLVALILVFSWNWYSGLFAGGASELVVKLLLCLWNSILVAVASAGGYELLADPKAEKSFPPFGR